MIFVNSFQSRRANTTWACLQWLRNRCNDGMNQLIIPLGADLQRPGICRISVGALFEDIKHRNILWNVSLQRLEDLFFFRRHCHLCRLRLSAKHDAMGWSQPRPEPRQSGWGGRWQSWNWIRVFLGSFPKTACELLGCLLLTLYTWDVYLWYKCECSLCFLVAPAFLHNQNAPWHLDDFVDGIQDFSQTHETLLSESLKESLFPYLTSADRPLTAGRIESCSTLSGPKSPNFPLRSLWIWRHTRARKRSASSFDMAVDSHLNNSTCPLRDNLRLSQRLQHTTVYGAHIVSPLGARNQSDQKDVEKVIAATSRPRFEFCF